MNELLAAVLRWVGLAVAWLLEVERPYWAPRLARRMVRAAVLFLPFHSRTRYRDEWAAELEEAIEQGGPFTFALEVVLATPVIAARELSRATDWNHAVDPGLAYGGGLGCCAIGLATGIRLGAVAGGSWAAIGGGLGLLPGLWLASALGARRPSWRAAEVGGWIGAVLGLELGGLVGFQRGAGLAVLAGLAVGPVLGGVLVSWGAAATAVWLTGAGAEPPPRSAELTS